MKLLTVRDWTCGQGQGSHTVVPQAHSGRSLGYCQGYNATGGMLPPANTSTHSGAGRPVAREQETRKFTKIALSMVLVNKLRTLVAPSRRKGNPDFCLEEEAM